MTFHLKHSARVRGISPQIVLACMIAERIWARHGIVECWGTSFNDSVHGVASLHYEGDAVDLRSKNLPASIKHQIVQELKDALGADYDVILEGENTANEHIHVEFDPVSGVDDSLRRA